MKKINFWMSVICILAMCHLKAQTQLSNWIVSPNEVNFLTSSPTLVSGVTTGTSYRAYNNISDDQGNLLFYITQGKIYNNLNSTIGMFSEYISSTEIAIVPNPANTSNNCTNKYYIFYFIPYPSSTDAYLTYGEVDMNANGGAGLFTPSGVNYFVYGDQFTPLAVSKTNSNGKRFLYYNAGTLSGLKMLTISSTGVIPPTLVCGSGTGISEMELSDAGDKLVFVHPSGGINNIVIQPIDPLTGMPPTGSSATTFPVSSIYPILGLELDNSGNRLFYSVSGSTSGGVYWIDLTTSISTLIVGSSSGVYSMLEKSFNGTEIIYASAGQVNGIIANPSPAGSPPVLDGSWYIPLALPAYPGMGGTSQILMPDQIDGEDYGNYPHPFTVTISESTPLANCVGNTIILGTNLGHSSGYNYDWNLQGGSHSYITPTFSLAATNNEQIVSLTVTNSYGCSVTTSYTVPPASSTLCCTAATLTVSGNISTPLGSSYTGSAGTVIEVSSNATLYIDNNFTFNNTQIRMMPNSQIIVNPGKILMLNNSHLFGCEYMWEGIQLGDGSQLISTSGTTIDDANIAVLVDATGMATAPTISLTGNTLSKNYYGIEVQNYAGANYPLYVTGTFFLGNSASLYSPGTVLKPYIRYWTTPASTVYPITTEIGIYANTVNKMVIGSASAGNYFENLHYGIRAIYSNIDVNGCNFLNLNPPSITDGKGIWASGNSSTIVFRGSGTEYMLNVGISGSTSKCTFNGLPYGIYTDNCVSSDIRNNNFYEVTGDAIYITGCSYYRSNGIIKNNSNIQSNYIRPLNTVLQNGVIYDHNTYLNATVLTNTIVIQPASSLSSEGIYAIQTNTNSNSYTINSNSISGNFDDGIYCNNINSAQINSNYIYIQKGWNGTNAGIGININGGSLSTITQNTLDATSQFSNRNAIRGISLSSSKTNTIWCNNVELAEYGLNSYLDCSVADIDGNTFNGCYKGFNISWGAIGDQGSSSAGRSNMFTNTFGSAGIPLCNFFDDNSTGQHYYASGCAANSCPSYAYSGGSNEIVNCAATSRADGPTCNCARGGGHRMASIDNTKMHSSGLVTVYPNPTNDRFFIHGDNIESASIMISNLLGEIILENTIITEKGIDVSNFKNGIYICTIKLLDGTISQKQIVIVK